MQRDPAVDRRHILLSSSALFAASRSSAASEQRERATSGRLVAAEAGSSASPAREADAAQRPGTRLQVADIEYLPPGDEAVAIDLQRELSTVLRPEHFGAIGDGAADDTPALQRLLDRSAALGIPARLRPSSTYKVTRQLVLPSHLDFGGAPGAKIVASFADFTSTRASFSAQGTVMRAFDQTDIRICDGLRLELIESIPGRQVNGISLAKVTRCEIRDVEISGLNAGGCIMIDSCKEIDIIRPYIHDCILDRTTRGQLTAILTDDFRINGVGTFGIRLVQPRIERITSTSAFLAANGNIDQTDGINIQNGTTNVLIDSPYIDTVGEAIDCWGTDVTILGGLYLNVMLALKFIHGATRVRVYGGYARNCSIGGVGIYGGRISDTDDVQVQNFTVSGVGRPGPITSFSSNVRIGMEIREGGSKVKNSGFINCAVTESVATLYDYRCVGDGANCFFVSCRESGTATAGPYNLRNPNVAVMRAMGAAGEMTYGSYDGRGSRYARIDRNGTVTLRSDRNSQLSQPLYVANGGISGAATGQGTAIAFQLGRDAAEAPDDALTLGSLADAAWDNPANKTVKFQIRGLKSGNMQTYFETGPNAGTSLLLEIRSGQVLLKNVEVGDENSGGRGYRMLRVTN